MYLENVAKLDKPSLLCRELFIELFSLTDNIEFTEKSIQLEERAKELKCIKSYSAMIKAFKEWKESVEDEVESDVVNSPSGVTVFSDDVYPRLSTGQWTATERGVYRTTEFGTKWACPHPIIPVQILTNAETGLCKLKIAYKIRGRWQTKCIDKEIISSASKIVVLSKFGIMVTSENAKELVRYMSDIESLNTDIITEKVSTSKLGWIGGEFMPYGDTVEFDNEQNLKSIFDSLQSVGSRKTWYDMIKSLRQEGRIETMIYIAASLASVLVEPVNALPFVVNLWGETGKGKTVALMIAASIWANPSEGQFMTDAKATATALELRLDFLNNLPMLLDDMAQVKNQYDGDFSSLVYQWCAGKGKDRANRNLGLNKSTCWKNCILTNAEHSLVTTTMQGGAINRIIDVEMGDGYIYTNGNEIVECIKSNYGFCGPEFIEKIQADDFEEVRQLQKEYYQKIVDYAKSQDIEKEEKQILPMSIILTADCLAEKYLFQDGCRLDFEVCCDMLKNKGEVSEGERTYQYLIDKVHININKFEPSDDGTYRGEQWGVIEDGYAVIIGTIFTELLEKGNFSTKSFVKWAETNKLIQTSKNRYSRLKKLNGSPTRCVFIKLDPDDDTDEEFMKLMEYEQEELPFD